MHILHIFVSQDSCLVTSERVKVNASAVCCAVYMIYYTRMAV